MTVSAPQRSWWRGLLRRPNHASAANLPPQTAAMVTTGQPDALPRTLELTVTRRLSGFLQGNHLGVLTGPGSTLAEAREYQPGQDDVRAMDWAVMARTTIPHVRDTTADRELRTIVVADLTASMFFGTATCQKRDLVLAATASFGFLSSRYVDRFTVYLMTGSGIQRCRPGTGRLAIREALQEMVNVREQPTEPGATLGDALLAVDRQRTRRGLCIVISDFSDPDFAEPMQRLGMRHQVIAVRVSDPAERELPDAGVVDVVDPETGLTYEVNTGSARLRRKYAQAWAQRQEKVQAGIRVAGALELELRTERDWVSDVAHFLMASKQLAGSAGRAAQGRLSA